MDIIYRAFDGKEFEKEDDCLCYEKEITAEKYKMILLAQMITLKKSICLMG